MGVTSRLRALILSLGKIVPATGPRILPTGEEDYATHIANEGAGGAHGYESLEDLAAANPVLLFPPMIAMVQEHQRPDGSHHPHTLYLLKQKPEQRLNQMPGALHDVLMQYWQVFDPVRPAAPSGAPQMRYSPQVDARSGEASVSGGRPIFPGSRHGRAITQQEYNQLFKGTTVSVASNNLITGTPTPIDGYWEKTLDSTRHFWWSQQLPNGDWSAPISFGSETVEQNDYTATIYMWSTEQPLQPPYYLPGTGQKNNNPAGWADRIPAARPSLLHRLWATKAKKSASFELKSDWFPPYEIPMDPTRVRYSEVRTPDPNTINGGVFHEDDFTAAGWVGTPNDQHRYLARRQDVNSSWFVEQMAGESGAYADTVYRNFKLSEYDDVMNPMTAGFHRPVGKTPVGWTDTPAPATLDEITMQSTAEKYSTGELIGQWSNPVPANGQDVFFDEIRAEGGSAFKKEGTVTVPNSIVLRAFLSRGKNVIPSGSITYQWRRIYNDGRIENIALASQTDTLSLLPADVTGMAIYECVQSFGGTDYRSEYTVYDIADGIDAKALDIYADSPIVLIRPDKSITPSKLTLRAFGQNLSDLGKYTWKKNGVQVKDFNDATKPYLGDTLMVDYADFHNGAASVTYSVHTVDAHPGDTVTITRVTESLGANAISMILDNESQVVVLDASTGNTNFAVAKSRVQVFSGATDETADWKFTKTDQDVTSELLPLKDAAGADIPGTQSVRVTAMTAGKSAGAVTITATKGVRSISKVFSLARITDPVGATIAYIEPDATGFAFSPDTADTKKLTARLSVDNQLIAPDKYSVAWFLGAASVAASQLQELTLNRSQVSFTLTVRCEITYLGKKLVAVRDMTDVRDAFKKGKLYTLSLTDAAGNPVALDDVPPATHAWNAGNITVNGVVWSTSREGAVYETIREEYDTAWSAPVRIAGEKGEAGLNGTSTRMAKIYQWSITEPARPTTMELVPAGWTADTFGARPTTDHQLWLCMGDQTISNTPELLPPGWSTPIPFSGLRGVPGIDGKAATVEAGAISILGPDQVAYFRNAGTPQAAVFEIGIPGPRYTPNSSARLVEVKPTSSMTLFTGAGTTLGPFKLTNPQDHYRWYRIDGWGFAEADSTETDLISVTINTPDKLAGNPDIILQPKHHMLMGGLALSVRVDATMFAYLGPGESINLNMRLATVKGVHSRFGNYYSYVVQML